MIGVVVVSHSTNLARGVAELAGQMAPDVPIAVAGGTDDGGIGTSLELVSAAIAEAGAGGAVVLYDLGSAQMTAEMALELLDETQRERVVLVDAPLVEGAVAAATEAAGGGGLDAVRAAAQAARGAAEPADEAPAGEAPAAGAPAAGAPAAGDTERRVTLPNPLGLHARPAAVVARSLKDLDADVRLTRLDTGRTASARSVLGLTTLGAAGGVTVRVAGAGPDAADAVRIVADLLEGGFGET